MESIAGLYSKPGQGERSTELSFHWDPVAMEWNLWRPFFHWLTAQNNIQQIPLTTKQSFNSHLNTNGNSLNQIPAEVFEVFFSCATFFEFRIFPF